MATWTKKRFGGHPVTESPPGENLELLQASLSGSVILALDVSGSMYGERLAEAKTGCARFIDEAVEDGYSVGMLLWDHDVVGRSPLERSPRSARELLDSAQVRGNNDIVPCLAEAHKMLMERPAGDRVLAIFGDGDLGPVDAAKRAASLLTVAGQTQPVTSSSLTLSMPARLTAQPPSMASQRSVRPALQSRSRTSSSRCFSCRSVLLSSGSVRE